MELRNPAAYGYQQCPHRNGPGSPVRPRYPADTLRLSGVAGRQAASPAQAPAAPVRRASAAALSRPQPATPAAAPAASAAPPPTPQPAQSMRAWLSAYAKDFTLPAQEGERSILPLEAQRAEGGMTISDGRTTAPEDGYYMVLWELGVGGAQGGTTLQLGVNEAASQLTYALHPGYDNGQQVTWLSAGDKVGLFLQAEDGEKAEVQCTSAQFTVIRLG